MQVVHVRRDARSAQEMVTLRASPSSAQGSVQELNPAWWCATWKH